MASVKLDGTVLVEGEEVGSLDGFTFLPSLSETGGDAEEKAMILAAARRGLPDEIERRVAARPFLRPGFPAGWGRPDYLAGCFVGRLVRTDALCPRVEVADSDLLSTIKRPVWLTGWPSLSLIISIPCWPR